MDVIDRIANSQAELTEVGIEVRFEDLGGLPSGLCEIRGERTLLIDITLPSREQLEILETVVEHLRQQQSRNVA